MIKISELTPKSAPLADTDLLEISEEITDGFQSKSITGHEILATARTGMQSELVSGTNIKTINSNSVLGSGDIAVQPTLVSGTNIKTINSTSLLGSGNINVQGNPRTLESVNGLNLTGSTNQISASVLIPSGTLVTNNSIFINSLLTKTAGSSTSTGRIYINTSNSLSGATLLATLNGMNASNNYQRIYRTYYFDGTNLNGLLANAAASSELVSNIITLTPFNPATDYYLIFAVQNSSTTPDNLGHKRVIVQIYD